MAPLPTADSVATCRRTRTGWSARGASRQGAATSVRCACGAWRGSRRVGGGVCVWARRRACVARRRLPTAAGPVRVLPTAASPTPSPPAAVAVVSAQRVTRSGQRAARHAQGERAACVVLRRGGGAPCTGDDGGGVDGAEAEGGGHPRQGLAPRATTEVEAWRPEGPTRGSHTSGAHRRYAPRVAGARTRARIGHGRRVGDNAWAAARGRRCEGGSESCSEGAVGVWARSRQHSVQSTVTWCERCARAVSAWGGGVSCARAVALGRWREGGSAAAVRGRGHGSGRGYCAPSPLRSAELCLGSDGKSAQQAVAGRRLRVALEARGRVHRARGTALT